jgi:hypothetical protein
VLHRVSCNQIDQTEATWVFPGNLVRLKLSYCMENYQRLISRPVEQEWRITGMLASNSPFDTQRQLLARKKLLAATSLITYVSMIIGS